MSMVGSTREFTLTNRDSAGALFAPTTGVFETGPKGEPPAKTILLANMSNPSTGVYKTTYAPTRGGRHWWRWTITDSGGNRLVIGNYYSVDEDVG